MNKFTQGLLAAIVLNGLMNQALLANENITSNEADLTNIEVIEVVGAKISGSRSVQVADIQRKQAADLEDLLRDQPNLTVGGSFGAAQKVYIRGIEDTNLNVTIDRASQSGQLFHHQARLAIEPDLLKQVEIKAGAGTALDGFGALGGAIHFETKDVEDLLDFDETFGSLIKAGYFSNTQGTHLSASVFGRVNSSVNAMLTMGRRKGKEFKDGHSNKIKHTNYDQEVGLIKLEGKLSENDLLKLSHEQRKDDGRRNLRVHFNNAPWNQATEQKSKRNTSSVTYMHKDPLDFFNFSLGIYTTKNQFSFTEIDIDIDIDNADSMKIETNGIDIKNSSKLAAHDLTYGIQYRKNKTYHQATNASESDKAYAIYLQDSVDLNNFVSLSYGARFDDYSYNDAFGLTFSANDLSPNINFEYLVNSYWVLRLGYSQALKGQSTKQAMMVGNVQNSADLAAEKAKNKELSISYQNEGYYFTTTLFDTEINNVVSSTGNPTNGFLYQNIGTLESRGFDISFAKNWQSARIAINYAHNDPEIDDKPLNDNHFGIGTSYGDTLNLNVNYQLSVIDAELGWSSKIVKDMKNVPAQYPIKDGFDTHDVYFEWFPNAFDNAKVNFTIHNIFDEYYFDHGTFGFDLGSQSMIGLPESGRDIRLTLSWRI